MSSVAQGDRPSRPLYQPLDDQLPEIRLFTLLPASSWDAPLVGNLRNVPLDTPPPYEALSYAWGDHVLAFPVSIGGHTLNVTPNLFSALRSLRREDEPRVLWIDAICINQELHSERSHQVSLMGSVYSKCTRDLFWLGPNMKPAKKKPGESMDGFEADPELLRNGYDFGPGEDLTTGLDVMRRLAEKDIKLLESCRVHQGIIKPFDPNPLDKETPLAPWELEFGEYLAQQSAITPTLDSTTDKLVDKVFSGLKRFAGFARLGGRGITDDSTDESAGGTYEEGKLATQAEPKIVETTPAPRESRSLVFNDQVALEKTFLGPTAWNRVWVMQELSLAPKIQLVAGSQTLDWDVVSRFLGDSDYADAFHGEFGHGHVDVLTDRIFRRAQTIDHQRRLWKEVTQNQRESKLLDVLARFRSARSSDPRDKIYGLLGLATDNIKKEIKVDYESPAELVYANVSSKLINESENLDIICQSTWTFFVRNTEEQQYRWHRMDSPFHKTLPSWAANFELDGQVALFAQRSIFNAGRMTCEVPCRVIDRTVLVTKGTALGRLGPIRQDDYISINKGSSRWTDRFTLLQNWMRLYFGKSLLDQNASEDTYVTGESAFTAFWRTVCIDCEAYPMKRLTASQIARQNAQLKHLWPWIATRLKEEAEKERWEFYPSLFTDRLIGRMWEALRRSWSFCITDNGLYVLISQPAQEGDIVACLDGGKVPVVLRPVEHEGPEEHYKVVHVAYVHGFMDGEAHESVKLQKKLGLQEREFLLA